VRGYDAAKKVKGRKRHVVTDTSGLLVGVAIHPAIIQDRDGAGLVIEAIHDLFPWLRHLFADSVYNGPNLRQAFDSASGRSKSSNAPPRGGTFSSSHRDGWSSGPWHGSIETAAWQRTSRLPPRAPQPGYIAAVQLLIQLLIRRLACI
jgi:hypothetical protein